MGKEIERLPELPIYLCSTLEHNMHITSINRLRLAGFVTACVTAVVTFMQGDIVTAAGIIAAALSAPGAKVE